MSEAIELLFFDTFSHESSEEINLGLVQFPKPVFIHEIRIIPLGARVQADFPGGVRLGATNPSGFSIEFFVNDLSKQGAPTFEKIGELEYNQNGSIHLETRSKIPTDGLVLRGWYTTITLAVYGELTKTVPPEPEVATAEGASAEPPEVFTENAQNWPINIKQEEDDGSYNEGSHYTSYPADNANSSGYQWQKGHEDYESKPGEGGEAWEDKHWTKDRHGHDDFTGSGHLARTPPDHGTPEYDSGSRPPPGRGRSSGSGDWAPGGGPPPRKRPRTPPTKPPTPTQRSGDNSPTGGFESLSPDDVESISEGDIPETEGGEGSSAAEETEAPPLLDSSPPPPPPPAKDRDEKRPRSEELAAPEPPSPSRPLPEEFEPILSDEEMPDDPEAPFQDMADFDFGELEHEEFIKVFNPYTFEMGTFQWFEDPALAPGEVQEAIHARGRLSATPPTTVKGQRLDDLLKGLKDLRAGRETWVDSAELALSILVPSWPLLPNQQESLLILLDWVNFGLKFEEAVEQPALGNIVRHIKAGIRLVECLMSLGSDVATRVLLATNAQHKLLNLYSVPHMALSIKLMVLKALDSTLRYKSSSLLFIMSPTYGYKKLVRLVQETQLVRLKFALSSLLQKLHLYELLNLIGSYSSRPVEYLPSILDELYLTFQEASCRLGHPKRFLPVSTQFSCSLYSCDPYPAIYTYFRFSNLIDHLIDILSSELNSNQLVVAPICGLITQLSNSFDGLKFLGFSPKINSLIKILLGYETNPGVYPSLGLRLVYRLQLLCTMDALHYCLSVEDDPDRLQIIDLLHSLLSLSVSDVDHIGKSSLTFVLSQQDNFEVLFKLLKHPLVSQRKRSPTRGYLSDLMLFICKRSSNIEFFIKYSQKLLDFLSDHDFPELDDLPKILKPFQNYDDISNLIDGLKNNLESCTHLMSCGELISCLKLLDYLAIPEGNHEFVELKYKCVVLQLYSLDGLSVLNSILMKINEFYDHPYVHSSKFIGAQGYYLVSIVFPVLKLIRRLLTYVIQCRNTDFKDISHVLILLKTYKLLLAFPLNSEGYSLTKQCQNEIIEILLAFTLPLTSDSEEPSESLHKSLWTSMLQEIIKFTIDLPMNFTCGLLVLSEILPLPLPLQCKSPLTPQELNRSVNSRNLWSAHLHPCSSSIGNLIAIMSNSSQQSFLQLLRRVCIQLADLSAPSSKIVVNTLLNLIHELSTSNQSTELSRVISFLASLSSHSTIKSSVLHLIKKDQVHNPLFETLLNSLTSSSSSQSIQEPIINLLQSLSDFQISLYPPPSNFTLGLPDTELYLSNSLPSRDLLIPISTSIIDHLIEPGNSFNTILPALRTCGLIIEHDYGFYHFKTSLEKKESGFLSLLKKLEVNWPADTPPSHGYLATLSAAIDLLRALSSAEGYALRSTWLSPHELRALIAWTTTPPDHHPLNNIYTRIKDSEQKDTLSHLLTNISSLMELLKDVEAKVVEIQEPVLSPAEPLLAQFAARPVFVVSEPDDDRLSTTYWLSIPHIEDTDTDLDLVPLDLVEVAKTDLRDMSLVEATGELWPSSRESPRESLRSPVKRPLSDGGGPPSTRRPFVAPMRGRGGFRTSSQAPVTAPVPSPGSQSAPRPTDVFRSRPPNTSRPPSLHVDDFVALETCGAQPTGPTGYNKLTMRAAQDLLGGGGGRGGPRGPPRAPRTFGLDPRHPPRFFGAPQPYPHYQYYYYQP